MSTPVENTLPRARPKRAWWKLLLECVFVLYLVADNVSLVLNNIATHPDVQALSWVKPVGVLFTTALAVLWALFLLWVGKRICRKLREEYPRR